MGQACCCAQFPDFACCSARVMAWRKHTVTWASLEDGAPPPVLFDGTNGYEPALQYLLLHLRTRVWPSYGFPSRHSYLYLPLLAAPADNRQSPQLTPATRDFRPPDVVHRECTSRSPGSSRRHDQGHLLDGWEVGLIRLVPRAGADASSRLWVCSSTGACLHEPRALVTHIEHPGGSRHTVFGENAPGSADYGKYAGPRQSSVR